MLDIVLALAAVTTGLVVLAARSLPVAAWAFLGFALTVAAGTLALGAWDVAAAEALVGALGTFWLLRRAVRAEVRAAERAGAGHPAGLDGS